MRFQSKADRAHNGGPIDYNATENFPLCDIIFIVCLSIKHNSLVRGDAAINKPLVMPVCEV
jgi:hypothetical protein